MKALRIKALALQLGYAESMYASTLLVHRVPQDSTELTILPDGTTVVK